MGPKLSSFVISPDGNALAYITKQNDSESVAFYAYYDGKRVKIGENLIPVGISNKGKYIYYLSQEKDCLYVSNMNGEVKKLSANINPSGRYFFNSNMTQLIFSADGKWYLSVNGADKVKLTESDSDWLYSVAPQGCPRLSNAGRSENGPAYIYPLKNLTGHYFQEYDGKLFYINEKNRPADVICERTNFAQLTDDESALFYTEQQGNRYIACKTENTEFSAIVQIAEGTSPFIFTSNGETVHYCDNENTLWYQRADEKPKHIADDVHYFTLSHDNYVLFITDYSNSSGILYGCANGKDPQQILSDCFSVPTIYPTVSIIYANYDKASGTFDIYTADNGMNFEKIEEGAHW